MAVELLLVFELFQVVKLAFSFLSEEKLAPFLVDQLVELMIDVFFGRREVVIVKLVKLRNFLL